MSDSQLLMESPKERSSTVPVQYLAVTIVKAKDLVPRDKTGTSDPYCVVSIGKVSKKTKVIKKSVNPVWNEKLLL
jgi:stromal membrane-associated protein